VPYTIPDRKRKEGKTKDNKDLQRKGPKSPIPGFTANKKPVTP
jgi:hypothetical protein